MDAKTLKVDVFLNYNMEGGNPQNEFIVVGVQCEGGPEELNINTPLPWRFETIEEFQQAMFEHLPIEIAQQIESVGYYQHTSNDLWKLETTKAA